MSNDIIKLLLMTALSTCSFSPFGYIAFLYVLAVAFGLAYRAILRHFTKPVSNRQLFHNIGVKDQIVRVVLGVLFLLWGFQAWSPLLIFFSGFCFFEALARWCGFYAAFGKTTCPV